MYNIKNFKAKIFEKKMYEIQKIFIYNCINTKHIQQK